MLISCFFLVAVPPVGLYNSMMVMSISDFLNKFIKLILFEAYMFYYYRHMTEVESPLKQIQDSLQRLQSSLVLQLACTKHIFWVVIVITRDTLLGGVVGAMNFTIQDIGIMMVLCAAIRWLASAGKNCVKNSYSDSITEHY